jgi:uncharacterized protein DUF3108
MFLRRIQRCMSRSAARQLRFALAALTGVCLIYSPGLAAQTPDSAIIQSAPQPRIVAPSASYQFPNGRKFVYAVEWHVLTAGTATIQFDPDGAEEKLTATAATSGAVNFIFPVHSWFDAHIDPKTFCSTRIFKHSEEGKRKKETQIQIDPARGKSILDEKNLKTGESRHEEEDAPACSTDILGGFFYLASLPLLPESDETLPVVDGGKPSVVRARVEAREEIKVPAGDFRAIRVMLDPLSGKFQGKGQIWVWFSDDAAHSPVQMKAKLPWGIVMFRLQRIEK